MHSFNKVSVLNAFHWRIGVNQLFQFLVVLYLFKRVEYSFHWKLVDGSECTLSIIGGMEVFKGTGHYW